MENSRIKRMALTGRLSGSALLRETGARTEIGLSVRGVESGADMYAVGDRGILKSPAAEGFSEQTGVCAIVLVMEGRIVSSGFSGRCAGDRQRLLDEIRIRAAEPERRESPGEEEKRPEAAVTERILSQAGRLFSGLDTETEEPEFTRIPNPFPKTLPRSVWRRRRGDARLYGEEMTANGITALVAVPAEAGRGRGLYVRGAVTAKDGKKYYIVKNS